MEVLICKTAGLCAGAQRAYDMVINALENNNRVYVYKEILHNEVLIDDLKNRGAVFINNLNQIIGNSKVILRAHGEECAIYEYLYKNKIDYEDAICVSVKRVHEIAKEKQSLGYKIIVVGKKKNEELHDEVKSLISFLEEPIIISNKGDLKKLKLNQGGKYFIVAQTTYNVNDFNEIVKLIKINNSDSLIEYSNTICNFPLVNINESVKLAKDCDIIVVLGSKTSSNTNELYNSVKDLGFTIFSNDENEIVLDIRKYILDHKISKENLKICLLAGASTLKQKLQNLKILIENIK